MYAKGSPVRATLILSRLCNTRYYALPVRVRALFLRGMRVLHGLAGDWARSKLPDAGRLSAIQSGQAGSKQRNQETQTLK